MLKRHFPLFVLIGTILGIFIANFSPHTFLLGWDSLPVELNPGLNIQRSIFSVWQEFQGLGLLAGNGHAADLPRQLILLPFSFLPLNFIRQAYVFLMLALGPIGAYFLIKKLLSYKGKTINNLIPVLGGLFYLLNLATIQTFYVAFEPFVTHFAALPWLLLSTIYFIAEGNKKTLLFFIIVNLLAIPQGQVPTVFFVYLVFLSVFLLVLIIETRKKSIFKKCVQIIALTLIINAFWLLPFGYFLLTNSQVALNAKINQMATETTYLQNKEFGNIWEVMLLKGFWFNNVDLNSHNQFYYMFSLWRQHLTPIISAIGYLFFSIILLGFASIKRKMPFVIPFSALFLLSFTMLTTNTPPFSWIDEIIRKIPLFNEAFRSSFTKFSIGSSLFYSIFFAKGTECIITYLKRFFNQLKYLGLSISLILAFLLMIFSFPIFQGHLFYDKERVTIPKEYFDLFNFFKKQNPNARIANFPQNSFWGWGFYKWGYGGSGFLWYGIKQPIMDRAFDPWSSYNENYYWEISRALYSKNEALFEEILNKYQISWLILDKNIYSPTAPKSIFIPELKKMISKIPSIKEASTFGKIEVYSVNLKDKPNQFIYVTNKLPNANSYNWGGQDQAYTDLENYISSTDSLISNNFYPFRSLFTNKTQEETEFEMSENQNSLEFTRTIFLSNSKDITIPSFLSKENIIATNFYTKRDKNNLTVYIKIETPQVFIDNKKIWGQIIEKPLFIIPLKTKYPLHLNLNGIFSFVIKNTEAVSETTFLALNNNNLITITDNDFNNPQTQLIPSGFSKLLYPQKESTIAIPKGKNYKLHISIPKINDNYLSFNADFSKNIAINSCDNFRKGEISSSQNKDFSLYSKNATSCTNFFLPTLDHKEAYIIIIESKNQKGRSLHMWIENPKEEFAAIDTYLPENKSETQSAYILPPQEIFSTSYSIHFDNISIGKDEAINTLSKVSLYPIPYNFLTSIVLGKNQPTTNFIAPKSITVSHPNESLYILNAEATKDNSTQTIILSQAFNNGWKAYETKTANFLTLGFPFLFGKELKNHVLVNNWANGWVLDNTGSKNLKFVIIFWPQYLEYFGFILLGASLLLVTLTKGEKHAKI